MSVEAAILEHVLADAAVAALVGERGYMELAPQSASRPLIVAQLVSNAGERHLGGPDSLAQARVQISISADSVSDRALVSIAVREALDGLQSQTLGTGEVATVVRSIALEDRRNMAEPLGDASQRVRYRQIMDFMVWHRQSVPAH